MFMAKDTKNGESRALPINGAVREVLAGTVRRLDSQYILQSEGATVERNKTRFQLCLSQGGDQGFQIS